SGGSGGGPLRGSVVPWTKYGGLDGGAIVTDRCTTWISCDLFPSFNKVCSQVLCFPCDFFSD
ncbi:hypothetical protein A2U01_0108882, partial [Trifolium medium]|nr:hypothetical protein [Trifolium medium]